MGGRASAGGGGGGEWSRGAWGLARRGGGDQAKPVLAGAVGVLWAIGGAPGSWSQVERVGVGGGTQPVPVSQDPRAAAEAAAGSSQVGA